MGILPNHAPEAPSRRPPRYNRRNFSSSTGCTATGSPWGAIGQNRSGLCFRSFPRKRESSVFGSGSPLSRGRTDNESIQRNQITHLACGFLLGPGIAKANRAAEHRLARFRIPIEAKIALSLELHRYLKLRVGKCRFEASAAQRFEGIRIEIGGEIFSAAWIRPCEQRIVEAHLGSHGMARRYPMDRGLHLASVRRVAAARGGIVRAPQFNHLAVRIFHSLAAGDEIGIAQPHFGTR